MENCGVGAIPIDEINGAIGLSSKCEAAWETVHIEMLVPPAYRGCAMKRGLIASELCSCLTGR